jgi:hypothetical protein
VCKIGIAFFAFAIINALSKIHSAPIESVVGGVAINLVFLGAIIMIMVRVKKALRT